MLDAIFDIYLLEALVNGFLLGGVLALLALGLNLIFGVIDVVWICYAELVMLGMYTVYFLYAQHGVPLVFAGAAGMLLVAAVGCIIHFAVISPLLGTAPINPLLATGGLLFFLQSFATLAFGIDFRNIGLKLPILEVADMYISAPRLIAFGVALVGMVALYLFLAKTYVGTAIRAISQDREIMTLMGVNANRIYLITSAIGGALAGLAAAVLVMQWDVYPAVGLQFGPITFMICVLGGLGNMLGGFIAAFILSEIIAVGGFYFALEWGYVVAFIFFIVMMFIRPQGIMGARR